MSKSLRNEVSGLRTENLMNCIDIMGQLSKSIRGDKSFDEAWDDELYRSVYRLEIESSKRSAQHEMKKLAYEDISDMGKLLHCLCERMAMYYHNGYAKGAELPGISWNMEANGVFVVTLTECALNMEHTFVSEDENGLAQRGMIFNVWLDVPDMEDEDPADGSLYENSCNCVGFTCDYEGECKDITFDPKDTDDAHLDLVRDILADFDVMAERQ